MTDRVNLLIAESRVDADQVISRFPQFFHHAVMTPWIIPNDVVVGEYVWSPRAQSLPARVRMRIRGELSSMIDGSSVEEIFPDTLLSW